MSRVDFERSEGFVISADWRVTLCPLKPKRGNIARGFDARSYQRERTSSGVGEDEGHHDGLEGTLVADGWDSAHAGGDHHAVPLRTTIRKSRLTQLGLAQCLPLAAAHSLLHRFVSLPYFPPFRFSSFTPPHSADGRSRPSLKVVDSRLQFGCCHNSPPLSGPLLGTRSLHPLF